MPWGGESWRRRKKLLSPPDHAWTRQKFIHCIGWGFWGGGRVVFLCPPSPWKMGTSKFSVYSCFKDSLLIVCQYSTKSYRVKGAHAFTRMPILASQDGLKIAHFINHARPRERVRKRLVVMISQHRIQSQLVSSSAAKRLFFYNLTLPPNHRRYSSDAIS